MTRERFIELVTAEQEPLRRFLLGLCGGNRMEADDIAQETLIKAYLASDSYVEHFKFSTWLLKIGYHTFLDHQRQSQPLLYPLDDTLPGGIPSDTAFAYEDLYQAINALPVKTRSAILLYYINGYSVLEISRIMGSTPFAIRKQLSRGREQLRKLIKQ